MLDFFSFFLLPINEINRQQGLTNIFENVISAFQSKEQRAEIKDGMSSKMREILSKGAKKPTSFAERVEDMKKDANRSQRDL